MTIRDRLAYFTACARSAGVPAFWLEDAAQDIQLALWRRRVREEDHGLWLVAVHRAAIDAVRRYGWDMRYPRPPQIVPLEDRWEESVYEPHELTDRLIAFRAAWATLSPAQRQVIRERLRTSKWPNAHQTRVSRARLRLRALAA